MASIYIHIPFCHHKCIYCSFYSVALKFDMDLYVSCLVKEIEHKKDLIHQDIRTLYFGGGTPSLLSIGQVERIFTSIKDTYNIYNVEEVTFEINSENSDIDYLKSLKKLGINRLSIGVESFDDNDLKLLNRSHTSYQAKSAVENACKAGFDNISVDLISNLPFSSFEKWKKNLDIAVNYGIKHLSCYTLMIEEGTMMQKLLDKGKYSPVSEENAIKEMDYTMEFLDKNGYVHYETSSYAKQGFESKHNMAYWTFQPYLGFGAGAHSYYNNRREWNVNDVYLYCNSVVKDDWQVIENHEYLSEKDRYNEYIMLSVRMDKGINVQYVKTEFCEYFDYFMQKLSNMIENGYFNKDLSLTVKGWHLQDTVILNMAL